MARSRLTARQKHKEHRACCNEIPLATMHLLDQAGHGCHIITDWS